MNTQKVQELINQEITKLHSRIGGKAARKQYAPAKWQLAKLTELGIIDLMPAGFGHSDAEAVIKAATTEGTAVMNAYGEGEAIPASDLAKAIKEIEPESLVPATEAQIENIEELKDKHAIAYGNKYQNAALDESAHASAMLSLEQIHEIERRNALHVIERVFIERIEAGKLTSQQAALVIRILSANSTPQQVLEYVLLNPEVVEHFGDNAKEWFDGLRTVQDQWPPSSLQEAESLYESVSAYCNQRASERRNAFFAQFMK